MFTTTQLVLYTGWSESWRGCCEIAFVLWLYHLTVLWQLTVFCLLKFSCIVSNNSVYQAFSVSDSMAWNSLPFFVWDPVSRTDYFGRLCKTYILVRATLLHPAHDGFLTIHTHPFNGPFSGTTRVSWYLKGKTNLDFTVKVLKAVNDNAVYKSTLTHSYADTCATLDSALLRFAGMYPCTTLDQINFGSTFCRIIVTFTKFFSPLLKWWWQES